MYKIINILKQIEIGGKMIICRGKIIAFWGQGFHFFLEGTRFLLRVLIYLGHYYLQYFQ